MTSPPSPRSWETTALRRVATVKTGKTVAPAPSSPSDVEAPYITAAHIQPLGRMIDVDDKVMWFAPHELAALDLREGDLLVVEGGAGYGRPAVVSGDYTGWGFQNHVNRIRPREGLSDTRFLYYVFEHFLASGITAVTGAGATFPTLSAEKVRSMVLAVPPISEQRDIACLLDRETAQIDAIIEAQGDLVRALVARKHAAMANATFHRVGAGTRLKWSLRERDERAGSAAEYLPLLSVSIDWGIRRRDESINQAASEDLSHYKVARKGDIVLNRMRAFQGALGRALEDGIVSPDYAVFECEARVSPGWIASLMRSAPFVSEMKSRIRGIGSADAAQVRTPRLNAKDFLDILVDIPSIEEQSAERDHWRKVTLRIDSMVAAANESISLMQERRAALISAAVTGRIDPQSGQGTTHDALEAS